MLNKKNKKIISILSAVFVIVLIFSSLWVMIKGGYDKQNKIILVLKEFIPTNISRKIRDTVLYIPKLQEEKELLKLIVDKYEQKYEGKLIKEEKIKSSNNKFYNLKEFFIPFDRIDLTKGWNTDANTFTKHYLEIVDNNVLVISGRGETIFFEKKNISTDKLKQVQINNNINNIIKESNIKFFGIRDLFLSSDKKLYISFYFKDEKGYSLNIYYADMNFEKLNFKVFYKSDLYWDKFTVRTGGRITEFKDNKILLTLGDFADEINPQNINSLKGKIISIDKLTRKHEILSIGHRNPQGIFYIKEKDVIVNSEHGPKGGDEININFQKSDKIPNYGWAVSSYGTTYGNKAIYKDSHKKFGFIEPFKKYVPSIGVSQIDFNINTQKEYEFFISSLRAASIYKMKVNNSLNKIINEERIYFPDQRIRDLKYDKETSSLFIIFEAIPSIAILRLS